MCSSSIVSNDSHIFWDTSTLASPPPFPTGTSTTPSHASKANITPLLYCCRLTSTTYLKEFSPSPRDSPVYCLTTSTAFLSLSSRQCIIPILKQAATNQFSFRATMCTILVACGRVRSMQPCWSNRQACFEPQTKPIALCSRENSLSWSTALMPYKWYCQVSLKPVLSSLTTRMVFGVSRAIRWSLNLRMRVCLCIDGLRNWVRRGSWVASEASGQCANGLRPSLVGKKLTSWSLTGDQG